MEHADWGSYLTLTLDSQPTWIVGCAFKYANAPGNTDAYNGQILRWRNATDVHAAVRVNMDGTLSLMRDIVVLGTSASAPAIGVFHYLEWAVTIHNTLGQSVLRVDGTPVITLTNVDTQAGATALAETLQIGNLAVNFLANQGLMQVDDLYICDGTGSAPYTTFLGDCRVDTLWPMAEGTVQQWTPSTGTTHYTLVDEAAPTTTDYVSDATVGHRETYGMAGLSAATGTLYAVQLDLAALKASASAGSLTPVLVSGASVALGTATALATSQLYTRHLQVTDPATGAAWTEAGVNALQGGADVAVGTATALQLSQVVLEVLRVNGTEGPLPPEAGPHPHMQVIA